MQYSITREIPGRLRVKLAGPVEGLLDADAYAKVCAEEAH